ncbi:hypothetical protein A9Q87_07800 [Flavobacteriales bacterium 34_180_T64]|nr:hypothetical protein A9Q87_07800 [Flavobacteriales bacterium 34_180_T64]
MRQIIEQLQKNKILFYNLLKDETEAMFLWKQKPEKWCLLEILCHLHDEECEDFRFRVQWVLEHPNTVPPPINPVSWVTERNYIDQNYNAMLSKFLVERAQSIQWLLTLKDVNWKHSFEHSKLGTLTAGYFLTNWLAHDYLHFRQILKLKFDYLQHQSGVNLDYAGTW